MVAFRESDDTEDTGEVVLIFLDDDACQVTLRLSPHALDALRKRIPGVPDPHPK